MLHIILIILKTIGIVLLTVLLLLLAAILLVLFAPIQYRVEIRYGPEDYGSLGNATWLGPLIRLDVSFKKGEGLRAALKAAGCRLFGIPKEESTGPSPKQKAVRSGGRIARRDRLNGKNAGESKNGHRQTPAELPKKDVTESRAANLAEKKPVTETSAAQPAKEKQPAAEACAGKQGHAAAELPEIPETNRAEKPSRPRAMADGIRRMIGKAKKLPEAIRPLKRNLESIRDSIRNLKNTISQYLDILKEEETWEVLRAVKKHLLYLWKHYRPRKAKGRLHYGFVDPSITGQVAGMLYLLFSNPGNDIEIAPEFDTEETVLDGELSLSGRIRLFHLVRVVLALLLDKDLRRLISRVKGLKAA